MNTSIQESKKGQTQGLIENEELTIKVASTHEQVSAMSEEHKAKARQGAASLHKLFEETLKAKGEYNLDEISWNGEDELEMQYLSQNALHSFILETEKLGKKVTYEKVLKVKISD